MDLFGTAGIRGDARAKVTPTLALAVGRAVGADGGTVVVGRDGRVTSHALEDALVAGLESAGAAVGRVGAVPTSALAFASRGRRGAMITASHNPPSDNGIKLFDDGVEYDRDAERRIADRVSADEPPTTWEAWTAGERIHVLPEYRSAVGDYARAHGRSIDGLRVAVDCGTGMASNATPAVLRDLGAAVVALNATVDGRFPSRDPKPTPEALAGFRRFVADADVALGLAHDGDADRIVVVAPDGGIVHEDTVLAILAEHYVRRSEAGDPVVVTTPNASSRVDERVGAGGGRVERCALGALHEGISATREAGTRDTAIVFAGEPWKHIHPGFGGWIDGVVSAAVLARLVAEAGGVPALREPVAERPYRKAAVDCPEEAKARTMSRVGEALPDQFPDAAVDTEYGIRIERPDGSWLLVRPSGTEPVIRLYAESDAVDELMHAARSTVETAVKDATDA